MFVKRTPAFAVGEIKIASTRKRHFAERRAATAKLGADSPFVRRKR